MQTAKIYHIRHDDFGIDPFHITSRGLARDQFFAELVSKVVPGTTQKFTRAVRSSRMHSDGALDCSQL